ncbi:Uncharacterized protein APZ42_022967 [Daphnia magna]|uniref:Uncharacterized protein n=1 Tax=Daphnia magna TaxID=35525 RepID=A0A164VBT2_9CRUS|nr:Uncharacterized protein APZ42_022967 [Daphnia magna]
MFLFSRAPERARSRFLNDPPLAPDAIGFSPPFESQLRALHFGEQVGLDALKKKSLYACSRFERRIDDMTVRHARTHRVLTYTRHTRDGFLLSYAATSVNKIEIYL